MEKFHEALKYTASIESLDMQYKDTSILRRNKPGNLLEFECLMNKWNKLTEFQDVQAACNSITLNLKEDVVM